MYCGALYFSTLLFVTAYDLCVLYRTAYCYGAVGGTCYVARAECGPVYSGRGDQLAECELWGGRGKFYLTLTGLAYREVGFRAGFDFSIRAGYL